MHTVAILSPGDMGHTVGQVLSSNGMRIITCLQGRSQRTRSLAQQAKMEDVPDYPTLVQQADTILSILVPAQAKIAAESVADALSKTTAEVIYVDCNAISPGTVRSVGAIIEQAGGRFVDAGIIGPPPTKKGLTRFYASGPHARAFEELGSFGLDVRLIGTRIGSASAIKMCYAALTKGLAALGTELLTAAESLGVSDSLREELMMSQRALLEHLERQLPIMPMKSRRWIGEMEEISMTFEQLGLTPKIMQGAADMYRFVGETHLAEQTPENRDRTLTAGDMAEIFARVLGTSAWRS